MTDTNSKPSKPKLLVLIGPTAVGKTKLSLSLAQTFDCEIISGDSMQVYRGMDIGTAKATPEERRIVPHHMIDIHEPDYPFSVAEFQDRCKQLIAEIGGRGKLPFIVGGTGLYIESVCYDFRFTEGATDGQLRERLQQYAELHGAEQLHERLRLIDPQSAQRIHVRDIRRIIRAIEVFELTGKTMTEHLALQNKQSPYQLCILGLTMDRGLLYKRIEDRIDEMIRTGLVDEVRNLMNRGYTGNLVSMQGLGYKEIVGYLSGEYSLEEAVDLLKRNTRRFAKRQLSWFRHMDDVGWIDVTDQSNFAAQLATVHGIIAGRLHLDEKN